MSTSLGVAPNTVSITQVSVLPDGKLEVDYEVAYPSAVAAANAAVRLDSAAHANANPSQNEDYRSTNSYSNSSTSS